MATGGVRVTEWLQLGGGVNERLQVVASMSGYWQCHRVTEWLLVVSLSDSLLVLSLSGYWYCQCVSEWLLVLSLCQ